MRMVILGLTIILIFFDIIFPELVLRYELFFEIIEMLLIVFMVIRLIQDFIKIKKLKEFLKKRWIEIIILLIIIILLKFRIPIRRLGENTERFIYTGSRVIKATSESIREEF